MSVSEVVVIQLLSRQSTGVNQNCITCFVTGSRLGDDGLCVDAGAAWVKNGAFIANATPSYRVL